MRQRRTSDNPADAAFDAVCGFLSYRQRTADEIKRYLRKKGYEDISDEVLERLVRLGFVDDADFARRWIKERSSSKGYGPIRLRSELTRLGVPDALIKSAMLTDYPYADEDDIIASVAAKLLKRSSGKTADAAKKSALAGLLRRGYSYAQARTAIDRAFSCESDPYPE
jgi:regulatory protein